MDENESKLNAALAALPAHLKGVVEPQASSVPAPVVGVRPLPTLHMDTVEVARDGTRIQTTLHGRDDVRQSDRLPPGYKARSVGEMSFDPRLAYEIALDIDDAAAVFTKYGYEERAAVSLLSDPVFARTVQGYRDEIKVSGIGFKLKAKIQAEDLLNHSYALATDPEVPPSVRADMIKWTAKVAGYEPKDDNAGGKGGGGTFALNITFAGEQPVVVSASSSQRQVNEFEGE